MTNKIEQLSMLQQSITNINVQKQNFQTQLMEIDSALTELEKTDTAYKIIGNIMVKLPKKELLDELNSKKEAIQLRIKSFEKQETQLREKASTLQQEVMNEIKKKE